MSKQRSGKMYHMVTVWSSGKSHDSHPPTPLMRFVTLMLEMITGEFSLSNREGSKHHFIGGELRGDWEHCLCWPGKPVTLEGVNPDFQANTSDHGPSSLPAALTIYYRWRIFFFFFLCHVWLSKQWDSCRGLFLALLFIPTIFQRNISR